MRPGNYLEEDLGSGYDLVLLFNVLHGHPAAGNQALLARVAAAHRGDHRVAGRF
jgi:hypothetical protein